jgi:hemolysin III
LKPHLRGHFHQAMFFIVLGAGLPLIADAYAKNLAIPVLVYILCALTLFSISAIYHRVHWNEEKRAFWRKLDHSSIYLMIAGTFTPIAWIVLSEKSSGQLLTLIWIVAGVGILQSLFFVHIPKALSAFIYVLAGYLVLPYVPELRAALGDGQIAWIALGGLFYSIGAICYALKKPTLNPKVFSYHEVFHLMVNLGAVAHFVVIRHIILIS